MSSETATDGTEECKHCGSDIDGEPLNQLSAVEFDDDDAEKDGYTQVNATYDDGPYCSWNCLESHPSRSVQTETDY